MKQLYNSNSIFVEQIPESLYEEILDFETGSLKQKSHVRPNRIFTADKHIFLSNNEKVFIL